MDAQPPDLEPDAVASPHGVGGLTVAVTGAGGFIGSAIVRRLASHGASVRALLGPAGADVVPAPPGVDTTVADIGDLRALEDLVAGVDVVIHAAGAPSVPASFEQPADFARVHAVGTANLLQALRGRQVRRLVHLSSAELYAPSAARVAEDDRLEPRSPYAVAKLAAEGMVRILAPAVGIEAVILRPFSVYGPGSPGRSLVGSVIRQALRAESVSVADLRPVRDYCYVDDVADAVVRACDHAMPEPVRAYNIGSGHGTSVAEVVRCVLDCVGRDIPVVPAPLSDRPASATVTALVAVAERAQRELGWHPSTALADGIALTVRSLRGTAADHG